MRTRPRVPPGALHARQDPPGWLDQGLHGPRAPGYRRLSGSSHYWPKLVLTGLNQPQMHTDQVALYFRGLLSIRGCLVKVPSKRSL